MVIRVDSYNGLQIRLQPSLTMTGLLVVFVLLVLLHEQLEPVQASFSVALPLTVRSPYLSCWLPQVNGSDNATLPYHISRRRPTFLGYVCSYPRPLFIFACSRHKIGMSMCVLMTLYITSSDRLSPDPPQSTLLLRGVSI